jgi:tetratricopeptide (TPR) repeat protein
MYMAPEQATGHAVGPEADFYALGVCLFEALTGRPPFDGAPLEILLRKQREVAPRASSLVDGVPDDIDALCASMLAFDPQTRPSSAQILRALGHETQGATPSHSPTQNAPFVGRARELEALSSAFQGRGSGNAVVVRGESGMGKSCLVRRFIDLTTLANPDLVVLAGRCYEREAVPYKAFDGVVDALARFLKRMPSGEAAAFLPTRPAPLVQVFPVLRRVEAIAALTSTLEPVQMDPIELRSRAFAGLRDLLTRVADRRPLIVTIDDLQWADAESLALLGELLREPEAPGLLLVATVRATATDGPEAAARVKQALAGFPKEPRLIEVERLSADHALELASMLLTSAAPNRGATADGIAREAEGHPLYIDALVRHAMVAGRDAHATLRLEDALGEQIRRLDAPARRVITLLAVAGAPMAQSVLASASQVAPQDFARLVSFLRVAHLASITGARGRDSIDTYHDKVRAAVLAMLDSTERRAHHRSLAIALEASGSASAESLATHWHGAGEVAIAAKHAERAGDDAARALAFDHAATFYERALEVVPDDAERRVELYEKLGNARANAGRSVLSAEAYQRAAVDADAARALEFRRRAAEQLLGGGRYDAGLRAAKEVLQSIGVRLARSPLGALFTLVFWRIYLRVRGLSFRPRDPSELTPRELTKLDTCWSIGFALSFADNIVGAAFSARNLALALRYGDRERVARALSLEIGYVACGGDRSWPQVERLRAKARELGEKTRNPHVHGWIVAATGLAYYLTGDFEQTLDQEMKGQAFFTECTGVAWELSTARSLEMNARWLLGDLRTFLERHPRYLRDAVNRGDIYAATGLRTASPGHYWLILDRPDQGRGQLVASEADLSSAAFTAMHAMAMFMHVQHDLYEGRPRAALERLEAAQPLIRRSLLQQVATIRMTVYYHRATALLELALTEPDRARALGERALRDARRLSQQKWTAPLGVAQEGALAALLGDRARAEALFRRAIPSIRERGMHLFAVATERALGIALGGAAGDAMVRAADAWMTEHGVARPDRYAPVLLPQIPAARPRRA